MSAKHWPATLAIGAAAFGMALPATPQGTGNNARIELVATFPHQVTGVTVSERGRVFVNFPRWTEDTAVSVAELMRDGSLRAYPNTEWNSWRNKRKDEISPKDHWVTVQSVVADGRGSLWVLDPAAPANEKLVQDGPKLVRIDLATNRVVRAIAFGEDVAPQGSYLNDVRFSQDGRFAFITDSGARGAIVVVELASGKAKRVLDGDPSTQYKKGATARVNGKPLYRLDGRKVQFSSDGIALSKDGRYLYWQALTGDTLYRIATQVLETQGFNGQDVSGFVQNYGINGMSDGLWIARGTDFMYISAFSENAIRVRDLAQGPSAAPRVVVSDPRLHWPDTFAQGPNGTIYVTTSRIQDSAWFNKDAPLALPTQLWRLRGAPGERGAAGERGGPEE
jgi:sugar lactone lactonase YvrE